MTKLKYVLWFGLLVPSLLFAQTWQAESGDKQIAVLELFTSEGCGLCPAADRWVHDLPNQGITDEQLIVLGFHIDYLNDSKGWVDRFASPVFSERQRQLARLNLFQSVFTPEFVVSGEVIHNWEKHVKQVVQAVNGFKPEAHIVLTATQNVDGLTIDTRVSVAGQENRQFSKLYLTVIEDDIISKVSGGDNAGATFNHQNLVRKWIGPIELNADGDSQFMTTFALDDEWNCDKLTVVALVQNLEDGYVLQGLALPLKK